MADVRQSDRQHIYEVVYESYRPNARLKLPDGLHTKSTGVGVPADPLVIRIHVAVERVHDQQGLRMLRAHFEDGVSLRAIARLEGWNPNGAYKTLHSRWEGLIDEAIDHHMGERLASDIILAFVKYF